MMLRRRWTGAPLVLALVIGCGTVAGASQGRPGAAEPAGTPGANGLGDPYFPAMGNGGYDVRRYRIDATVGLRPGRLVRAETEVTATATQALSRLTLDFSLPVDAVRVDGRVARWRQSGNALIVTPPATVPDGDRFTVTVDYHSIGTPSGWFRTPAGSGSTEVVAIGEPRVAQWWFPSNDHPRDAARYDVTLRVPRGRQGVSVGRLVAHRTTARRSVWRWRTAEPLATYVAFFAAGRFALRSERVGDVRYTYAVSRLLPAHRRRTNLRLLRLTPRLVAGLEADLGPYPYADGGGLVTAAFRTEDWAMETQTRPVYPAMTPGRAARRLLVHELGHQWFGDLVRPDRWRDIVDNEGFARWTELRWVERHDGPGATSQFLAMYDDHPAGSRFWRMPIDDPGPDRLFAWPVYDRGGMMVQALRNRIGDRAFFRLLRRWTREYGGRPARVADFEALAADVSGADLTDFFDAWLRTTAKPARTVANGFPP